MPGIRKTREQHEASGSTKKNPKRFANDPHTPPVPKEPLGNAPRHFTKDQQKIWHEIVGASPDGLLFSCDRIVIEQAVRLTEKMRDDSQPFSSTDNGQLLNAMGKLGGTPGDRLRLNVSPVTVEPNKKPDDPWDSL